MKDSRLREASVECLLCAKGVPLDCTGREHRVNPAHGETFVGPCTQPRKPQVPASDPKETSVEKGLIMGSPVAELREKVKFLQGELAAVETKAGIENVFEQGKAQGRVEVASDLKAKLKALICELNSVTGVVGVKAMAKRLTAILDGIPSDGASNNLQRKIEALRELSEKATAGPWTRDDFYFVGAVKDGRPNGEVIGQATPTRSGLLTLNQNRANAKFIVACVNAVRAILDGKG